MKKTSTLTKLGFLIYLALAFFISSCSKDSSAPIANSSKSSIQTRSTDEIPIPEIRNNRLYFASFDALNDFSNKLKNVEDIDAYNLKLKNAGFVSFNYFLNAEADEQDVIQVENKEINTDMPDEIFKTLLNVNQEIQIDNVICRLQKNYGFIYEEKDKNLVDEFSALKPDFNEELYAYKKQILVFKLNVKEHTTGTISARSVSIGGYGWKTQNSYNEYVPDVYRSRGHHWATNVLFYKSMGVATYHEKKIRHSCWLFFICTDWSAWNAETIRLYMYGDGTVTTATPVASTTWPVKYSEDFVRNNQNKIVYAFSTSWGVTITLGNKPIVLPIVNITIPNVVSPANSSTTTDVLNCTTFHHANGYVPTPNLLNWKW